MWVEVIACVACVVTLMLSALIQGVFAPRCPFCRKRGCDCEIWYEIDGSRGGA